MRSRCSASPEHGFFFWTPLAILAAGWARPAVAIREPGHPGRPASATAGRDRRVHAADARAAGVRQRQRGIMDGGRRVRAAPVRRRSRFCWWSVSRRCGGRCRAVPARAAADRGRDRHLVEYRAHDTLRRRADGPPAPRPAPEHLRCVRDRAPRWPRVCSIASLHEREIFLQAAKHAAATVRHAASAVWQFAACGSLTSRTSGCRWSAPTASRRWRRAMRWRARARGDADCAARYAHAEAGSVRVLRPAADRRFAIEQAPVRGPQFARRIGYLSFALGRCAGRNGPTCCSRGISVSRALFAHCPRAAPAGGVRIARLRARRHRGAAAWSPPRAAPARVSWRALAHAKRSSGGSADGYVTITNALADPLTARFGASRASCGGPRRRASRAADRHEFDAATAGPVVGYAGHLYAWKGVDVLLEALARVPDARGLIVGGHAGEPDLPRLRARAQQLGITARVEFTGLVPPASVPSCSRARRAGAPQSGRRRSRRDSRRR